MKLWIARDKHIPDGTFPYPEDFNGNLFLYGNEPYIEKYTSREGVWTCKREEFIELDYKLFPEITFENSPQEVELKLVNNSKNMTIECYDCHELINYTEDDIIDGWSVKCHCCGEKISILE
jgi:hypothetical protein